MISRKSAILVLFGEGGHCTAMHRLIKALQVNATDCVQIHEHKAISLPEIRAYRVPRIMPKNRGRWRFITLPALLLINLIISIWVLLRYDIRSMITTGPGIAVIPAFLMRTIGHHPVIYLESWCRFNSLSMTGVILSHLGATIYVQNIELVPLNRRYRFSGRL